MTTSHLAGLRGSDGLIRIHGHRGARGVMPENTRAGFAYAFAIGIEVIELDVLSTADGVAVVTHNPYLSPTSTRMPNGAWLDAEDVGVHNLTLNQLQSYDIGGLTAR